MNRQTALLQLGFSFFLLVLLAACGSPSSGPGAKSPRPVAIKLQMSSGSPGKLKALNAPSGPIASIKVKVTGDGEVLASETTSVLPEDLLIKMTVEIVPGERVFSVTALDAGGEIHSEGQATVAIEASKRGAPPQVVTIVMKSVIPPVPLSKTLTVRVVGLVKAADPVPGARVLLHHPTTGAFITERTTDVNGVADFGDIDLLFGLTRASITVQRPGNSLHSAVNILPGDYTVTSEPSVGTSPAQATFTVTATALPPEVLNVEVQVGHFVDFDGTSFPVSVGTVGTVTAPDRQAVALRPGGTFDLFAFGTDIGGAVNRCGYLDGLIPDLVDVTTQNIPLGTLPVDIPFVVVGGVNVSVDVEVLRSGSIFDARSLGAPSPTGIVSVCDDPKINHYDVVVETPFLGLGLTRLGIDLVFNQLPTATDLNSITLPNLSIDTLTRDPATQAFSWTASGVDIADIDLAHVELDWDDGVLGVMHWEMFVASTDGIGTGGSFVLPHLPPPTTANLFPEMPPAAGLVFTLTLVGIESPGVGTAGYEQSIALLNANAFNGERMILTSTTQAIFANRTEGGGL